MVLGYMERHAWPVVVLSCVTGLLVQGLCTWLHCKGCTRGKCVQHEMTSAAGQL